MGVCDSSINLDKPNTITPSPNHYESLEYSKITSNKNNLSNNFKEILATNLIKKDTRKLNIINPNVNGMSKNLNSKNIYSNEQKNKLSFIEGINTTKTVDKKHGNDKLNTTNNNSTNFNKSEIGTNNYKHSLDKKKFSYVRNDSKKLFKMKEKNININNINLHNNSCKDVKPFYYHPKSIFSSKSNKRAYINNTNNNHLNGKINKKRIKNFNFTKSKDKLLSKKNSNKNINNLTRTEIHKSFNNISRISSTDTLNIINNFYISNKINYTFSQIVDLHNFYNSTNKKVLYMIDDDKSNYSQIKKDIKNYSTEIDYNNILRNNKDMNDINKIYAELLKLKERKWQDDLINISKIISTIRTQKSKNQEINVNDILNKILTLFDHFNWILNSIGKFFSSLINENQKELTTNNNLDSFNFPHNDLSVWFKGFKWKGLYIRVEKDIFSINNIKKEIKALNYFFLDYLHIIWNKDILDDLDMNNNKYNILSNNIVFPLIGYCQINGCILIVSAIIKQESNNTNREELVKKGNDGLVFSKIKMRDDYISEEKNKSTSRSQNKCDNFKENLLQNSNSKNINDFNKKCLINKLNHSIDYNTNIRSGSTSKNKTPEIISQNEENQNIPNDITFFKNNYYIDDLLRSKLFSSINQDSLIKIKHGKFILINVSKFVPNLFENQFKNDINKINFYGTVEGQKKYFTLNYNFSLQINLKNIYEPKKSFKNFECFDTLSPKIVFEKIYKMIPSTKLTLKDVIIGNMIFRIIYLNTIENRKNSKKKFVDFLFNYKPEYNKNNINNKGNNLNDNKKQKENDFLLVQEPYVILYDLIEPIKLDYSLIKSVKTKDNQTELINDIFFFRTNYIDYFMSWCDMFNRNSFNIKRYSDLKYYMKKFGINQNLLFFAMIKINNEEISDIIKIHLLVKSFKFICFDKSSRAMTNKIRKKSKFKDLNLYENLRSQLLIYINSLLYPSEILPSFHKLFKGIYEQLLFYANILFFKYKLIDDYLSLGILNLNKFSLNKNKILYSFFNIQSPQDFLKHCILIARKKPFLFLSELEYELNFLIDPYIKFKSSISIESMSKKLKIEHLEINNIIIKTFIDPGEISGLILTKIIKRHKEKCIEKSKNTNTRNITFGSLKDKEDNIKDYDTTNDELKINNVIYFSKLNMKPNIENNKENRIKYKNNQYEDIIGNEIEFEIRSDNLIDTNSNNENNFFNKNISNINYNENNDLISKISSDKTNEELEISNKKIIFNKNKNKIKSNNISKIENNFFKEINENIFFFVPANCHKVSFNFEKKNNQQNLYPNLCQYYSVLHIQIIKDWVYLNDKIFKSITNSHNFVCEKALIKSYMFLFLYSYYIGKGKMDDHIPIGTEILSLLKNNCQYYLTLNEIAMINLIQALSNKNYVQKEEFYSKSVMLLLMNYGDPRGRFNDSHGMLQFPLWEIARKTYLLNEAIINEYLKEMYQALDFFDKNKGLYNINQKKNDEMYKTNFADNINSHYEKIKIMNITGMNNLIKKTEQNNNTNADNINDTESVYSMIYNIDESPNGININKELTELDISLNKSCFDKNIIQKACITHYIFPSISSKTKNAGFVFFRKEFIVYIIKEILSLFLSQSVLYSKNYLEKHISDELISIKEIKINKTLINLEKTKETRKELKYIQTPLKRKNINNLNSEKKIMNSSIRINPYLQLDKKSASKNIKNYQTNQNLSNPKNSKSYNNGFNKTKLVPNSTKTNNNSIMLRKAESKEKSIKKNTDNNTKEDIINHKHTRNKKIFSLFLYNELFDKLSYKNNLPNGIVISFGNNKHNETSHDRYEKLTLPRVIFKLKNEMIDKICSGWEHNILINNKGEIFSFGRNQSYQCGLPNKDKNLINKESINDPINISKLHNNLKAIKASCGNEHSLFISQDRTVYGIGCNEGGLLGLSSNNIKTYKPIKINFMHKLSTNKIENYNGKIIDISCGTMHNLALSEDGKIFAWGSIQGGQLGLPSDYLINLQKNSNADQTYYISNPTLIPYFIDNKIIISQISCGEAHSLALSNKGKVYSWGYGSNGQLGLGFCEDIYEPGEGLINSRIFEPQLIETFKDYSYKMNKIISYNYNNFKIKEIKCGKTYSMFINSGNDLFACGINDLNQLGFKDKEKKEKILNIQCDDYIYPSLLRCFNNRKIEKISCGEGHCLAIVEEIYDNIKSIWSWGNNQFGQIGHGLMVKISLPKEIEYLTDYNMNDFSDVSCGGFHSLILLKSKRSIDWIEKDYEEFILGILKEIGDL